MGLSQLLDENRRNIDVFGEGESQVIKSDEVEGAGPLTYVEVREILEDKKYTSDEIDKFMRHSPKPAGFNQSITKLLECYKKWKLANYPRTPFKTPKSTKLPDLPGKNLFNTPDDIPSPETPKKRTKPEKKEEKEEKKEEKKEKNKRSFTLNAKVFDNIKNTKPRIEFRRILKTFFEELSLTSFGSLPGNFVQSISELKLPLVKDANEEKKDRLRSILNSFKTNLSKREEPKETVVKRHIIKDVKPSKAKAKVKVVKATKATVKKIIKVKKPRKKAVRKTKGKGVDELLK